MLKLKLLFVTSLLVTSPFWLVLYVKFSYVHIFFLLALQNPTKTWFSHSFDTFWLAESVGFWVSYSFCFVQTHILQTSGLFQFARQASTKHLAINILKPSNQQLDVLLCCPPRCHDPPKSQWPNICNNWQKQSIFTVFLTYLAKQKVHILDVYPLVNVYITMENHHFQWEIPLYMVIFNSLLFLPDRCRHARGDSVKLLVRACLCSFRSL